MMKQFWVQSCCHISVKSLRPQVGQMVRWFTVNKVATLLRNAICRFKQSVFLWLRFTLNIDESLPSITGHIENMVRLKNQKQTHSLRFKPLWHSVPMNAKIQEPPIPIPTSPGKRDRGSEQVIPQMSTWLTCLELSRFRLLV